MKLKFDDRGLVPMIIQDANGGAVLSLFYANKEVLERMESTGYVWRFSRSANKVMKKGTDSGNLQKVISIAPDCDGDAILVRVLPSGPACHKGMVSCFGEETQSVILTELLQVIRDRKTNPKSDSYTSGLLKSRDKIIDKLNEECSELIEAKTKNEIVWETADLLYFIFLFLEENDVELREVLEELARRRKKSTFSTDVFYFLNHA